MGRRNTTDWYWQVGSDLSRLNEELTKRRPGLANTKGWQPRVDVMDLGDRIGVRIELPGIRGEDVALQYNAERSALLVRGVRQDEGAESGRVGFFQLEIPYGEFEREVDIPPIPIRVKGIRAQYRNGFLLVELPKAERVVVKSTIVIQKV